MTEPADDRDAVTRLLARMRAGDRDAENEVYESLLEELRRLAGSLLRGGSPTPTLGVTGLVSELYLRIADRDTPEWSDRRHFIRYAARAMRSALTDRARAGAADKRRPAGRRVELEGLRGGDHREEVDLLALDEALEQLERIDPRLTELVQLRFYAGLTRDQAAEALGVSEREVRRLWDFARTWLREELA